MNLNAFNMYKKLSDEEERLATQIVDIAIRYIKSLALVCWKASMKSALHTNCRSDRLYFKGKKKFLSSIRQCVLRMVCVWIY